MLNETLFGTSLFGFYTQSEARAGHDERQRSRTSAVIDTPGRAEHHPPCARAESVRRARSPAWAGTAWRVGAPHDEGAT